MSKKGLPFQLHITVSIDGPASIHDKNRITPLGEGTHNAVEKNLKRLAQMFGDLSEDHLLINTVISEPSYRFNEIIQNYFDSLKWLPPNVTKFCTQATSADVEYEYQGINGPRERLMRSKLENSDNDFAPLITWEKDNILSNLKSNSLKLKDNSSIMKNYMDKELTLIHKRRLSNKPIHEYYLNGCCIPGERRIYVTSNGDYKLCEKMGPSPSIGNVNVGLDIEKTKEIYIKDFSKKIKPYCSECWAIHLCPLCYVNSFDENGTKVEFRHLSCESHRVLLENNLSLYHEIYEQNPDQLDYLNDIDIT